MCLDECIVPKPPEASGDVSGIGIALRYCGPVACGLWEIEWSVEPGHRTCRFPTTSSEVEVKGESTGTFYRAARRQS